MEPVLAGLAVLGVLLGSAAVGACMVLFLAASAGRVRRARAPVRPTRLRGLSRRRLTAPGTAVVSARASEQRFCCLGAGRGLRPCRGHRTRSTGATSAHCNCRHRPGRSGCGLPALAATLGDEQRRNADARRGVRSRGQRSLAPSPHRQSRTGRRLGSTCCVRRGVHPRRRRHPPTHHLCGGMRRGRHRHGGSVDPHELSAPEGIRTPNLLIRSQMLYPLSYGRMCSVVGGGERI